MKHVLIVIRKEFARFFKDPRLVCGTLILPGLLIFVMYTLIGNFLYDEEAVRTVKVVNPSTTFQMYIDAADEISQQTGVPLGVTIENQEDNSQETVDALIKEVRDGRTQVLVVFPENFDAMLNPGNAPEQRPNIVLRYNSSEMESFQAYNTVMQLFNSFEDGISGLFNINATESGDVVTQEQSQASAMAQIFPVLLISFLFAGCMAIAPESIAGEKERGTIATLLVTPIRRSNLVIGKILSMSVLAVLSAISSFIGTFLSFPKLMGVKLGDVLAIYSVGEYFALLAVIISAVLLIIALVSIVSTFAKSVKEATSFAGPLMILCLLASLSTMITGTVTAPAVFVFPLYNCIQIMVQIFSLQFSWTCFAVTLISNIVWLAIAIFALVKMFNSERIIFNK